MKLLKPSYTDWAEAAQRQRTACIGAAALDIRFSILTTVYERTDAGLFKLTIDSVLGQTFPFFEWILLAHGPIGAEVENALVKLDRRDDVTVLRLPENVGIIRGMRICLEAATGEYVVPLDADDLLTGDALHILAQACGRHDLPALVYTDEDILVDNKRCAPYWRPDWDPVLNLSSSFIWHLCCLRRDVALAADVYGDSAANWCHDWDSVFRIVQAGHIPVHVPEIVYHWRQHPISSTNRAVPESGSRQSTRAVLQRFLSGTPRPDLYRIEDFPVFRGAPEWTITRLPLEAPGAALLLLGTDDSQTAEPTGESPWHRSVAVAEPARARPVRGWRFWHRREPIPPQTIAPLKAALATIIEPLSIVRSASITPVGDSWFWEAVKLFELHGNVRLVHGLVLDQNQMVQRGGEVFLRDGRLVCPQRGKLATDAGAFALALKPHCTASVPTDFFMADTHFLRETLDSLPDDTPLAGLGIRLSATARASGFLTAFSPLIVGRATSTLFDGAPEDLSKLAEAVLGLAECGQASQTVRGQAGFLNHVGEYR